MRLENDSTGFALCYILMFLKEWLTVAEKDNVEMHGMTTDPMVLKDNNGKYFIGKLMYDALYDKWYANPIERLESRKFDTFSLALTELMITQLSGKQGHLVQGKFIAGE